MQYLELRLHMADIIWGSPDIEVQKHVLFLHLACIIGTNANLMDLGKFASILPEHSGGSWAGDRAMQLRCLQQSVNIIVSKSTIAKCTG